MLNKALLKTQGMQKSALFILILLLASQSLMAMTRDGEDLLRKAAAIVEETNRQYAGSEQERKVSMATVLPEPDDKNVIITFTIDELNRIHVVDVKGGYAYVNLYIKSSLEGKAIKSDSAIPGINYVMAIKLPASA